MLNCPEMVCEWDVASESHFTEYRTAIMMPSDTDRQVQKKKAPQGFELQTYFSEDLLGFNLSVFPGVFLLSRWRLSGSPVDSAIRFGPGLRLMIVTLFI